MPPSTTLLLPLFLKVAGRDVLVVGAGEVARAKIAALLDAGARVRVVAPGAVEAVRAWATEGRIVWAERPFEGGDLDGAWLVFAATSEAAVQAAVGREADARRVFCVAVDDPANASAYSGAVVRRDPFLVAISSSGAAPALTRLVREVLEHVLPEDRWVERAKELRAKWMAEKTPMGGRFAELVRAIAREE
ncbi:MAG TPA: bifunctional precorrin-2 dehydrogenase/sirohydrochlorin ferrochelatase [Polyangiaceae bacterium]